MEWIKTEDKMPNNKERVLCYGILDLGIGSQIYLAKFHAEDKYNLPTFVRGGYGVMDVTHWMPLPYPPTTSEGKENN